MIKRFLIKFLTKNLFNWVTEEDLIQITNSGVKHKGITLTPEQVDKLAEEAVWIKNSYIWKTLDAEVKYTSQLMFVAAKNYEETLSPKLLLRAMEILNKQIDKISKLRLK